MGYYIQYVLLYIVCPTIYSRISSEVSISYYIQQELLYIVCHSITLVNVLTELYTYLHSNSLTYFKYFNAVSHCFSFICESSNNNVSGEATGLKQAARFFMEAENDEHQLGLPSKRKGVWDCITVRGLRSDIYISTFLYIVTHQFILTVSIYGNVSKAVCFYIQ